MEERIRRAVELFKQGCNCSQAVCAAFAPLEGYTEEQALRMSSSFGGGIGRMRQTCGAACAMFILAGLHEGNTDPGNRGAKAANYRLVQQLADEFTKRNGSLICARLLGLPDQEHSDTDPEKRTEQYYQKRPCVRIVEEAARIWAEHLEHETI